MNTTELLTGITPVQIDEMIDDFGRACSGLALSHCGHGPAFKELADREKYGPVTRILADARQAARKGNRARCHLLEGIATAIYGCIRLADAQELEKSLGARLGLPCPSKAESQSEDESSRKEIAMLDTQKQFTFEDLVECLNEDGVNFASREQDGAIMAGFGGEHGPVHLLARVDGERNVLALTFRLPLTVPEEKRIEMAEAITRANYGIVVGNFEMDMRDGELNYKVAVPIDDAMLSQAQFRHCMGAALRTIQRYLPAYYRIVFSGTCPEEAIDECEEH
jgi:hypothetical protein